MNLICKHCNANLDDGDIFEYFLNLHSDTVKALKDAKSYGWSETNKVHFYRSVIIQCKNGSQYTICPDCKQKL